MYTVCRTFTVYLKATFSFGSPGWFWFSKNDLFILLFLSFLLLFYYLLFLSFFVPKLQYKQYNTDYIMFCDTLTPYFFFSAGSRNFIGYIIYHTDTCQFICTMFMLVFTVNTVDMM